MIASTSAISHLGLPEAQKDLVPLLKWHKTENNDRSE